MYFVLMAVVFCGLVIFSFVLKYQEKPLVIVAFWILGGFIFYVILNQRRLFQLVNKDLSEGEKEVFEGTIELKEVKHIFSRKIWIDDMSFALGKYEFDSFEIGDRVMIAMAVHSGLMLNAELIERVE